MTENDVYMSIIVKFFCEIVDPHLVTFFTDFLQ